MAARLAIFLSVLAASSLGQQSANRVKAGDRAPEIDWTKIVQSPESAKYQPGLTGQYTVLQFVPPVTANAQAIVQWNRLIAKFRDRPVQFIWIASENWSVVQPFLREHPMDGWLLIDEKNETTRDYGCEMGGDVIVDPSGKIAGFTLFLDPEQLAGVLDGEVRLEDEPERTLPPRGPEKPDMAPSYEAHISPSKTQGTEGSSGPDFWVQRGFDLKSMISLVYEKDLSRVILPKSLDKDDKFDFVVVLPEARDQQTIHRLVQRAIEKKFNVSTVVESKPAEVYLMTAVKGKTPSAKTGSDSFGGGSMSSSSVVFSLPAGTAPTPEAFKKAVEELSKHPENTGLSNISAANTTMDQFREDLERGLGRPVIDETGLEGVYDLEVHGNAGNRDEFIRMLHDQTGLVLTPATRNIEVLTVSSLN
jgi:uncharacterized protein (TIGR03435 family)